MDLLDPELPEAGWSAALRQVPRRPDWPEGHGQRRRLRPIFIGSHDVACCCFHLHYLRVLTNRLKAYIYIQGSVENLWILDSSDLLQLIDQQVTLMTEIEAH